MLSGGPLSGLDVLRLADPHAATRDKIAVGDEVQLMDGLHGEVVGVVELVDFDGEPSPKVVREGFRVKLAETGHVITTAATDIAAVLRN
jgi:hypothetical protein